MESSERDYLLEKLSTLRDGEEHLERKLKNMTVERDDWEQQCGAACMAANDLYRSARCLLEHADSKSMPNPQAHLARTRLGADLNKHKNYAGG